MRHTWVTDDEGVSEYAYEDGYHNGPVCSVCDQAYCRWCAGMTWERLMQLDDCAGAGGDESHDEHKVSHEQQ